MVIILLILAGLVFVQPVWAQAVKVNFKLAKIVWEAPPPGGGPVDNYVVACKHAVTGIAFTPITTGSLDLQTIIAVPTPVIGESYRCTITSQNAGGDGIPSVDIVGIHTDVSPPPPSTVIKPGQPQNPRFVPVVP